MATNRNFLIVVIAVIIMVAGSFLFVIKEPEKTFLNEIKEPLPKDIMSKSEVVKLKTKDGVEIAGDYYSVSVPGEIGVLMLHMMPANRKSYSAFAEKIQEAGWQGLAIDFRGHGESHGGPVGYQLFKDEDHQKSILDVEAGAEFLKTKGIKKIFLVGASIGANLSLQYLAEHSDAKAAVLLSPGLNYRGVKTDESAKKVYHTKAIYLTAAKDDDYSYETVQGLYDILPKEVARELKLFDSGGHGTKLFETHPELIGTIINWLKSL